MAYFKYEGKSIYYEEIGEGSPVVFLHGNTASSNMFLPVLPLYREGYKVILLDFLGHGKSERLSSFPVELWYEEGLQTAALLKNLNCGQAALIGTSGGAWAALNAALECPELVSMVVADSFDGRELADDFADNLLAERKESKNDELGRQFYEWCQGNDWEDIVDCDTEALVRGAREKIPLFHKDLSELQMPVLLLGSREDDMVRPDFPQEYERISEIAGCVKMHIFETGRHPSLLANAEESARLIREFLELNK